MKQWNIRYIRVCSLNLKSFFLKIRFTECHATNFFIIDFFCLWQKFTIKKQKIWRSNKWSEKKFLQIVMSCRKWTDCKGRNWKVSKWHLCLGQKQLDFKYSISRSIIPSNLKNKIVKSLKVGGMEITLEIVMFCRKREIL